MSKAFVRSRSTFLVQMQSSQFCSYHTHTCPCTRCAIMTSLHSQCSSCATSRSGCEPPEPRSLPRFIDKIRFSFVWGTGVDVSDGGWHHIDVGFKRQTAALRLIVDDSERTTAVPLDVASAAMGSTINLIIGNGGARAEYSCVKGNQMMCGNTAQAPCALQQCLRPFAGHIDDVYVCVKGSCRILIQAASAGYGI